MARLVEKARMRTSEAGNRACKPVRQIPPAPALLRTVPGFPRSRLARGFTLLELLVVITIMAVATAGVSLAMRDSSETALEREAQRLTVLLESARAQSRASGIPVYWRTTTDGFMFDGLAPNALPHRWLTVGIAVRAVLGSSTTLQLGPEPIIGPQAVELISINPSSAPSNERPDRSLRVATDGLRPFTVQAPAQP